MSRTVANKTGAGRPLLSKLLNRRAASRPARLVGRCVGAVVLLVLFVLAFSSNDMALLPLVQQMAVDGCLGIAVVLLFGYAGELSFAYGLLFGVSGYVSWWTVDHGWPMLLGYLAGLIASIVAAMIIALPAMRIRQLQLAMVTIAAGLAGVEIFGNITGYSGVVGLPELQFGSRSVGLSDVRTSTVAALVLLLTVFVLCEVIASGRFGRRWLLMKESDATARSFGISVPTERILAFGMSGLLVGLMGAVFPTILGLLSPSQYGFQTVVTALIVALIGGTLHPGGALLGAVVFVEIGERVSSISVGVSQIIYGLMLLAILLVLPNGVIGLVDTISDRVKNRRDVGRESAEDPDAPIHRPKSAGAAPSADGAGGVAISATGLVRSFSGFRAVDGVDIEARYGQITGIIGANGAGKSTLIDLLTGFTACSAGAVYFQEDGTRRELTSIRGTGRARLGVQRTFQHANVVPELTVRENLRVAIEAQHSPPRRSRVTGRIEEALAIAGIEAFGDQLPAALPYGIIKLLDVARLVAVEPKVAFFDEPAAGLGEAELPRLAACLRHLRSLGVCVLLIEHNLDFISGISDKLVAMDLGKVIAAGAPTDVLESEAVVRSYSAQATLGKEEAADA